MNPTAKSPTIMFRRPCYHQARDYQKCVSIPQPHTINACLTTNLISPRATARHPSGKLMRQRVTFSARTTCKDVQNPSDVPVVYCTPRHGLCDAVEFSNGIGFVYNLSNIDSTACWEIFDRSLDLSRTLFSSYKTKKQNNNIYLLNKLEISPRPNTDNVTNAIETNPAKLLNTVEQERDMINIKPMPSFSSASIARKAGTDVILSVHIKQRKKNEDEVEKHDSCHLPTAAAGTISKDNYVNKRNHHCMYINQDYNVYQRRQVEMEKTTNRSTTFDDTFRINNSRSASRFKLNRIENRQILRLDVA